MFVLFIYGFQFHISHISEICLNLFCLTYFIAPDLSRVFENVDYSLLFETLSSLGFDDPTLS